MNEENEARVIAAYTSDGRYRDGRFEFFFFFSRYAQSLLLSLLIQTRADSFLVTRKKSFAHYSTRKEMTATCSRPSATAVGKLWRGILPSNALYQLDSSVTPRSKYVHIIHFRRFSGRVKHTRARVSALFICEKKKKEKLEI